jgi:hypothetical protein
LPDALPADRSACLLVWAAPDLPVAERVAGCEWAVPVRFVPADYSGHRPRDAGSFAFGLQAKAEEYSAAVVAAAAEPPADWHSAD